MESYLKDQVNKIITYINNNYDVEAIKKESFFYKNNIYIATKKYDLDIGLSEPNEKHFLHNKAKCYLSFCYEANKKHRAELSYHAGGYHDKYFENDYSNIDRFLKEFCNRKKQKQLSIFDLGE